jgi:two-component system nitrate/nitrite response regulator NarL
MRRRRPATVPATVLVGLSSLLREGLTRILETADFRIAASVPCVQDLALGPAQTNQPILFIIDTDNDTQAALEEIRRVKEQYPAGRIAVLARHGQPRDLAMIFRAGANACIGDFVTCDALLKSLELVMLDEGISPFMILPLASNDSGRYEGEGTADGPGPEVLPPVTREEDYAPRLSGREKCIVRCLVEGDSNKVIARKIDIAEATVKVHIKAILRKIRVQNRTQAAIWAMNHDSSLLAINDGSKASSVMRPQISPPGSQPNGR